MIRWNVLQEDERVRMAAFKLGLDEQDPDDWDDEEVASTDGSEALTVVDLRVRRRTRRTLRTRSRKMSSHQYRIPCPGCAAGGYALRLR